MQKLGLADLRAESEQNAVGLNEAVVQVLMIRRSFQTWRQVLLDDSRGSLCLGLLLLVEGRTEEPKDQEKERPRAKAKEGDSTSSLAVHLSTPGKTPLWIRQLYLDVIRIETGQEPVREVVLELLEVRHRFRKKRSTQCSERAPVEARLGGALRAMFQSLCILRDASRKELGRLGPILPGLCLDNAKCLDLGRSRTTRDLRDPVRFPLNLLVASLSEQPTGTVVEDQDRGPPMMASLSEQSSVGT